jgi:membrane protein implicated in regulation of membrane protease activity
MSLKKFKEPRPITAGAWSGLAAPAVAAAAVHSTAPWYVAVPVLVVALALTIWRRRRGGGGPSGPGPSGGS